MAYIYILKDAKTNSPWTALDIGEAVENITLVAWAEGVGSCQFGSVDRDKVKQLFRVPDNYEVALAIALGFTDESHAVEPYQGDPKYWRDEKGVHHVPKRTLESVLHWNGF
jgi:nitroreductase